MNKARTERTRALVRSSARRKNALHRVLGRVTLSVGGTGGNGLCGRPWKPMRSAVESRASRFLECIKHIKLRIFMQYFAYWRMPRKTGAWRSGERRAIIPADRPVCTPGRRAEAQPADAVASAGCARESEQNGTPRKVTRRAVQTGRGRTRAWKSKTCTDKSIIAKRRKRL